MREGVGGEKIFQAGDKACMKVLKKRGWLWEKQDASYDGCWSRGMETATWVRYRDNLMLHPNCCCEIIEGFGLGYAAASGEGEVDRFGGRDRQ